MSDDDRIPTQGEHRGVSLHADQSAARLAIVRRDIDRAHAIDGVAALVQFAEDVTRAPEARLLARAKALASIEEVVTQRGHRSRRPVYSRERIKATCPGLGSRRWQSRTHYGSLLDVRPRPRDPGPALRGLS